MQGLRRQLPSYRPVIALAIGLALAACQGGGDDDRKTADGGFGEDAEVHPRGDVGVDFADVGTGDRTLDDFNVLVEGAELHRLRANPQQDIELTVRVEIRGVVFEGVTLQLHGGLARTFPKKSYRLTFPDDDEFPVDFFPDRLPDGYRRLVFQASYIDPSFLGNRLTMDLVRELGGMAPHMSYATLSFNGEVEGLYSVSERIDRQFLRREGLERDCNLYKAVDHNANWAAKADPRAGFEQKFGDDGAKDLGRLLSALSATPTDHASFVESVEPILSLDDFMTFGIAHTFVGNRDTFTKNYYLHHADDEGTPFRLISWDADATFGVDWDGTVLDGRSLAWYGTDQFAPRLLSIETYRLRYVQRYRDALAASLSTDELLARIDRLTVEIRPYAEADMARWHPERDFEVEVSRVQAFAIERPAEMIGVLDGL